MENMIDKCIFNFLRNDQAGFQSTYTVLNPHQHSMRVSEVQQSCQHLVLSSFKTLAILECAWYSFIVVLISISLVRIMSSIFSNTYLSLYISFGELCAQNFYPFYCWLVSAPYIFWIHMNFTISLSISMKCQLKFWLGSYCVCSSIWG